MNSKVNIDTSDAQGSLKTFLSNRYKELKGMKGLGYSYRYFSTVAGFGSPNYLKLVMNGQRNLSAAAIPKFIKGLLLDEAQSVEFTRLAVDEISKNSKEVSAFLNVKKNLDATR